jgi:hypothetical protein
VDGTIRGAQFANDEKKVAEYVRKKKRALATIVMAGRGAESTLRDPRSGVPAGHMGEAVGTLSKEELVEQVQPETSVEPNETSRGRVSL